MKCPSCGYRFDPTVYNTPFSQRVRQGIAARKARGEFVGGAPWGQQLDADGLHLIPNPVEQAITQVALQAWLAGRSIEAIAAVLNDAGYRTRHGNPWRRRAIYHLLTRAAPAFRKEMELWRNGKMTLQHVRRLLSGRSRPAVSRSPNGA